MAVPAAGVEYRVAAQQVRLFILSEQRDVDWRVAVGLDDGEVDRLAKL